MIITDRFSALFGMLAHSSKKDGIGPRKIEGRASMSYVFHYEKKTGSLQFLVRLLLCF
jgi:hypothetical protein